MSTKENKTPARQFGVAQHDMCTLVVDDDAIFRELICAQLMAMGHRTVQAVDGLQARDILRSQDIDLALVDLQMPNMDGFDLIRGMRASPRCQNIPVTVISSRTDPEAVERAYEVGATSFLTKPVHWPTFSSHVDYLIRMCEFSRAQCARAERAEAACRMKDAAIASAVGVSLERVEKIGETAQLMLERMPESGEDAAVGFYLRSIIDNADDVADALRDAHDTTLVLARPGALDAVKIDLSELVDAAQEAAVDAAVKRRVQLNWKNDTENVHVVCDQNQMIAALSRIVVNAARFAPVTSAVEIHTQVHNDGMLTISVTDDGPGIDSEFYAACLSPFDHAKPLNTPVQDTQCDGVAFVKGVAEAHGGAFEIRSMPDRGTTMMIAVPAERIRLEAEAAA